MAQRTRLVPPEGWVELERLEMTREVGTALTGASLMAMVLAFLLFGYTARSAGSPLSWPEHGWLGWVVGGAITFVLHEALHGLVAKRYGARPRYGCARAGILPYFYCAPEWNFTRNPYLQIVLAPLVVLNLIGLALLWVPTLAPLALAVLVWNTSGAVGDLWMTWRVLRYPPGLIVVEEGMVARLMGPPAWRPRVSGQSWWPHLGHGATVSFSLLLLLPFALFIPLDLLYGAQRFALELPPVQGLPFVRFSSDGSGISLHIEGNAFLVWWLLLTLLFAWVRRRGRLRKENATASRIEPSL